MIEVQQTIEDTGIRFDVKGEKHELLYMQSWLAHYGQGHKFWPISDFPKSDFQNMTAFVFLDEDIDEKLNRIDFAALFKLTFAKFELKLPDASNTESDFMSRLERLVETMSNLPENTETGLDTTVLDVLKKDPSL